jgi:uncharacterized lipoprotein YajG
MSKRPSLILVVLAAAGLLLAGCAGTSSKTAKPNKVYPAWVINPDYPGHIGVVGSAPRQDMGGQDAQHRVAMLKARQELAQMIRVHVESTTRSEVEDRGGRVSRDLEVQTRLRSTEALSLERARVVDEWVDPETGELYIHLVTPSR